MYTGYQGSNSQKSEGRNDRGRGLTVQVMKLFRIITSRFFFLILWLVMQELKAMTAARLGKAAEQESQSQFVAQPTDSGLTIQVS